MSRENRDFGGRCCSPLTQESAWDTLTSMKTIFIALLLGIPLVAAAHPGKTDYRGGHRCMKGCEAWELWYREYHLHDKDWRPIRLSTSKPVRKKKDKELQLQPAPAEPELLSAATDTPAAAVAELPLADEPGLVPALVAAAFPAVVLLPALVRRNTRRRIPHSRKKPL